MNPSNRDDYLWLMSADAAPILREVQTAFLERINAVRIVKSIRKKTTPTRSALIMELAQLRIRARKKFTRPDEMFFTRRGLEQASGRRIAAYKAARFEGLVNVADICCGIGGDTLAIAQRNRSRRSTNQSSNVQTPSQHPTRTVGVDSDELTCLFAQKNLEVNEISPSKFSICPIEFANFGFSGFDGLHVDPDRRVKERTVAGNRFSPSLTDVFQRLPKRCSAAIKVAPATPSYDFFPQDCQREWIGDRRECKQQVLWTGPATVRPGHRTATFVGKKGTISQISVSEMELDQTVEIFDNLQRYIFEPHPAVLAAGMTDVIARKHGYRRFTPSIIYLTGDQPTDDPLLSQFEVLEVFPLNLRKTIDILQSLDVGVAEIKKRGIENVTAEQFGRMKLDGPNSATVILTRLGRNRIVVIAKRPNSPLTLPAEPISIDGGHPER